MPWAAHSYNVAFSDEIGHFEYCNADHRRGRRLHRPTASRTLDDDDTGCFSPAFSLLVKIGGCIATDADFDGPSYQHDWPGTDPNAARTTSTTRPRSRSRARSSTGRRTTRASRSRPTCRASRHPTPAASATGSAERTATTRRRARSSIRSTRPRARRRTSEAGDPKYRTGAAPGSSAAPASRARRTRSAGTRRTSTGRCCSASIRIPNPAMRLRTNNFRNVLGSNPCPA